MGLASGLIRIQLFLAVQNSLFCCLILKICVSYDIILMYYLNYEHTGSECKQLYRLLHVVILLFTACCYSSRYLSITVDEPESLSLHRLSLLPH